MPTPDLDAILAEGRAAIADAADLEALREAEQAHLSRRSPLGEVQRSLGGLDADARRALGQRVERAGPIAEAQFDNKRHRDNSRSRLSSSCRRHGLSRWPFFRP